MYAVLFTAKWAPANVGGVLPMYAGLAVSNSAQHETPTKIGCLRLHRRLIYAWICGVFRSTAVSTYCLKESSDKEKCLILYLITSDHEYTYHHWVIEKKNRAWTYPSVPIRHFMTDVKRLRNTSLILTPVWQVAFLLGSPIRLSDMQATRSFFSKWI